MGIKYVGIKYVLLVDGINLDVWLASVRGELEASDVTGRAFAPSWKGNCGGSQGNKYLASPSR